MDIGFCKGDTTHHNSLSIHLWMGYGIVVHMESLYISFEEERVTLD